MALFGSEPGIDIHRIDRFAFYDRAKSAYAIVITGETAKYGNIMVKKGVTPIYQEAVR
ncbi:RbsD/FucU domain-containing protein [Endozoicomonas sp. ONNA2]|uniref:RbsD/FucU domain-containing protein n=1 Tax=Endozoicomonas sp. ONNA2 TaxID=2828741 RepID=UPI002147AA5B|nr:RbsD/FucU domain-containing protein [Endozoicomonas sp. ONNA2]